MAYRLARQSLFEPQQTAAPEASALHGLDRTAGSELAEMAENRCFYAAAVTLLNCRRTAANRSTLPQRRGWCGSPKETPKGVFLEDKCRASPALEADCRSRIPTKLLPDTREGV